jgi:hypothetical protein
MNVRDKSSSTTVENDLSDVYGGKQGELGTKYCTGKCTSLSLEVTATSRV